MAKRKPRHAASPAPALSPITLKNDIGPDITFTGSLYAETSFFEDDSETLTRQNLYRTTDGPHAISITSMDEQKRFRRAYLVDRTDDSCTLINGDTEIPMPIELLMTLTRALCSIDRAKQQERLAIHNDAPHTEE